MLTQPSLKTTSPILELLGQFLEEQREHKPLYEYKAEVYLLNSAPTIPYR